MIQRLPIANAQVKAGNTSENLLNEIRQNIYSLYRAKEINKNVYNNILNSIKLQNRMDTIFMNSENSKTSDPHRLLLNLTYKINLKGSDKYLASSIVNIYYTWKYIKKSYKNNKFKISAPPWNEKFELPDGSYFVSDIKDCCEYVIKKHEKVADNPPIRTYVNKTENTITFRIKTEYCLQLLTPETMKLLGSTTSTKAKDESGENVPRLKLLKQY